jgi:hypothetical protein
VLTPRPGPAAADGLGSRTPPDQAARRPGTALGTVWAYPSPTAVPGTQPSPPPAESIRDDTPGRRCVLAPTQPLHRRFAALHALGVEGLSPPALGARFGWTWHTVRSGVRDFRARCRTGPLPPCALPRTAGARAPRPRRRHRRRSRPRPTAGTSAWHRGGACGPAVPAPAGPYRWWPAGASTTS